MTSRSPPGQRVSNRYSNLSTSGRSKRTSHSPPPTGRKSGPLRGIATSCTRDMLEISPVASWTRNVTPLSSTTVPGLVAVAPCDPETVLSGIPSPTCSCDTVSADGLGQVGEQNVDDCRVAWREHEVEAAGRGVSVQVPAAIVHHVAD